jgi:hypothetical protein
VFAFKDTVSDADVNTFCAVFTSAKETSEEAKETKEEFSQLKVPEPFVVKN